MVFKNVELLSADPLGKSIAAAIKNDKIFVFTGKLCPLDHWKNVGAEWQKYLAGTSDKAAHAKRHYGLLEIIKVSFMCQQ